MTGKFHNALLVAAFFGACTSAASFPVTVESCGRQVSVDAPPQRALSFGSNLTEIMLALGLEDRMLGFAGQGERLRATAAAQFPAVQNLREIQRSQPSLELFLEEEIDFYFAGWSYGMRIGGEVTPETLARYGVPVYELSESCVRLGQYKRPSFDYLFRDFENLGAVFGIEERAAALVASYRQRVDAVIAAAAGRERPSVFVYEEGQRVTTSAGGYSMPQAIIEAAGGVNIMQDVESSWIRADWETVVERNPQVIILVDTGRGTAEQQIEFLNSRPAFANIDAVRDGRFIVLTYDELTPGPRNIDAAEKLGRFLHGDH